MSSTWFCDACHKKYWAVDKSVLISTEVTQKIICEKCALRKPIGVLSPEGILFATEKQCSNCKQKYPAVAAFFAVDKRCKGGLGSWCRECQRAASLDYNQRNPQKPPSREQRRITALRYAHSDRGRQVLSMYRVENHDEIIERDRKRYHADIEYAREKGRKHYETHKEIYVEKARQRRAKDPEKARQVVRESLKRHPETLKISRQKRRALKRGLPMQFTSQDWQHALEYFEHSCVYCGRSDIELHQEHFIPFNNINCPGTLPHNILPACQPCNSSKADRDARLWLTWKFGEEISIKRMQAIESYFGLILQTKSKE